MGWFDTSDRKAVSPAILLVHGVFGSGKSYLLVTLILFLVRVFDQTNLKNSKILICSNTNVAVDRILLGLLDENFTRFIRVGSLKKIAKRLLDYIILNSPDGESRTLYFKHSKPL